MRVGARGVGYLPQRLDVLDDSLTVVDNVRAAAPAASANQVRANLARFLFRGDRAGQLAGTLSGGELFRAVLAALLLAEPPPQLLLLDEPTNNLDMASVRQLAQALDAYRGALLLASHDLPFLSSVTITRWLRLDRDSGLTAIDPPGAGHSRGRDGLLRLVAIGRSNRDIAAELFISAKTASVYVSHIMAKLGVASRVEAAVLAYRLGLGDQARPR